MEKLTVDFIISINIYKKIDILKKQLFNFKNCVLASYCVILNCNEEMYNLLKNENLEKNVYINPEVINKRRFHGSLAQGIVSNMTYAMDKFQFKYFIILSGRTVFYKTITIENLENCKKSTYIHPKKCYSSKLGEYYKNLEKNLYISSHEGLCFSFNICNIILTFLNSHDDIKKDLFNFNNAVEEFALQTISINETNEINEPNLNTGYIYIGSGVFEEIKDHKYTRKIFYDGNKILYSNMLLKYLNQKR